MVSFISAFIWQVQAGLGMRAEPGAGLDVYRARSHIVADPIPAGIATPTCVPAPGTNPNEAPVQHNAIGLHQC